MRHLLLASTSPYRREQLRRLRLPFDVAAPRYDEPTMPGLAPGALVLQHAEQKARSLAEAYPRSVIVGSDQLVVLGERVLGKPGDAEAARHQLREMSGRPHDLLTAVAVLDARDGTCATHLERTRLHVRALDEREISAYVRADDPIDCAGAYKIESLGIALFERIEGDDPSAIMGLPLIAVVRLLAGAGIDVLRSREPDGGNG